MIQRFTCVPTFEYDILVLSNGSVEQVEQSLIKMDKQLEHALPQHYRLTYLDSIAELVVYLDNFKQDKNKDIEFNGKIFFMFFDGLGFVQDILSDAIDYYQRCLVKKSDYHFELMYKLEYLNFDLNQFQNYQPYNKLNNSYFYFDSSMFDSNEVAFKDSFNYLVTIVNDVLKKVNFMIGHIKGIVIDDAQLQGDKIFPIHCLLRNYPRIERLELSSEFDGTNNARYIS